jgi:hypothetical protein
MRFESLSPAGVAFMFAPHPTLHNRPRTWHFPFSIFIMIYFAFAFFLFHKTAHISLAPPLPPPSPSLSQPPLSPSLSQDLAVPERGAVRPAAVRRPGVAFDAEAPA